jgi:hypothetical protein
MPRFWRQPLIASLVIARFNDTKREQLAYAVGNLKNVGTRIVGTIFPMTPARGKSRTSTAIRCGHAVLFVGDLSARSTAPIKLPEIMTSKDSSPPDDCMARRFVCGGNTGG